MIYAFVVGACIGFVAALGWCIWQEDGTAEVQQKALMRELCRAKLDVKEWERKYYSEVQQRVRYEAKVAELRWRLREMWLVRQVAKVGRFSVN